MLTSHIWCVSSRPMNQESSAPLMPVLEPEIPAEGPKVTKCPPFTAEQAAMIGLRSWPFQFGYNSERRHSRANIDDYDGNWWNR